MQPFILVSHQIKTYPAVFLFLDWESLEVLAELISLLFEKFLLCIVARSIRSGLIGSHAVVFGSPDGDEPVSDSIRETYRCTYNLYRMYMQRFMYAVVHFLHYVNGKRANLKLHCRMGGFN